MTFLQEAPVRMSACIIHVVDLSTTNTAIRPIYRACVNCYTTWLKIRRSLWRQILRLIMYLSYIHKRYSKWLFILPYIWVSVLPADLNMHVYLYIPPHFLGVQCELFS